MEQHAVLVFTRRGQNWRVLSPDFSIEAEDPSVEVLYRFAARMIQAEIKRFRSLHLPIPRLRSYAEVRIDDVWARRYGIRWGASVVRIVDIPDDASAGRSDGAFGQPGDRAPPDVRIRNR